MKLILLLTLFVIGLSLYIWRNITSKIAKNNVLNQFKKASKNSDFANSLCDLLEISYLKLDCESFNFNTIYEKLIGLQSENYKIVDLIKLEKDEYRVAFEMVIKDTMVCRNYDDGNEIN